MSARNFTAGTVPGVAANITSILQCTPALCSLEYATVLYVPTLAGNSLYLALFALLLVIQAVQCFFFRTYSYTIAMICGLVLEIVGYLGRVQMHFDVFAGNPFLLYIICLTIGPVFFTAALYLTLSRVITHYGTQYSRLQPKTYTLTFITSDVIALILQAVGGALADTAATNAASLQGVHIMIAGLAFQVVSLLAFSLLAGEFFGKVYGDRARRAGRADSKPSLRILGLAFAAATLFILIRSCFRVAELAHGFKGKLANEQVTFMVLEGAMISLATILMTACHPGIWLKSVWSAEVWKFRGGKAPEAEKRPALREGEWTAIEGGGSMEMK
ncbi:hypothetical protein BP6252_07358 [Coleophoma cylindrospora]|uniref:RTA1-domain-containing protein n=1 Tax=Coleophoma cylindrospora TaxID=1849047 RepID=A0A3D8RHY0_9HELO|nr:hypothetical protein BP6252_07358 [Coleophoma cylindrospora]